MSVHSWLTFKCPFVQTDIDTETCVCQAELCAKEYQPWHCIELGKILFYLSVSGWIVDVFRIGF